MKKIMVLLHTIDYIPSANGICTKAVIESLLSLYNDVAITCIACSEERVPNYTKGERYEVYRVRRGVSSALLRTNKSGFKYIFAKILYHFTKAAFFLWWPIEYPFLTERIYKQACALFENNEYDAIISVYKNIENVLAGIKVSREFPNTKHIVYFLDPLIGGRVSRVYQNRYSLWHIKKVEQYIAKQADRLIMMRSSFKAKEPYYKGCFYCDKISVSDFPLIELKTNVGAKQSNSPRIQMIFAGSLQKGIRDPEYILKILSALNRHEVTLHIYGLSDYDDLFNRYSNGKNLEIICHGQVPRNAIIANYSNADILINIGNKDTEMVPSKLLEYISTGKPILNLSFQEMDSCDYYLKRYPESCSINVNAKFQHNVHSLDVFLGRTHCVVSDNYLRSSFAENRPENTAKIIYDTLN